MLVNPNRVLVLSDLFTFGKNTKIVWMVFPIYPKSFKQLNSFSYPY